MKHPPQPGLRFPLTLQRLRSLGPSDVDDEVAEREALPLATGSRGKPIRRLLVLFAELLPSRVTHRRQARVGATVMREDRLRTLASKLEAILDELDAVGAQRVAIDVCMALERIRATLAAEEESESAGKAVPLSRDSAVRGGRAALDGAGRDHRGSAR